MVETGAWDTQLRSLYTTVTCKVFLGNCLCNLPSETAQGDCPWGGPVVPHQGKREALGMGSWLYVGLRDVEGSSCWRGKWILFCLEIRLLTAHSLKRQYAPLAWELQDSDLWFKQKMSNHPPVPLPTAYMQRGREIIGREMRTKGNWEDKGKWEGFKTWVTMVTLSDSVLKPPFGGEKKCV